MRTAHRITQNQLLAIGEAHGLDVRRNFNRANPADVIWLTRNGSTGELPVAAFEVAVSESPKGLRGSVTTLELISPALGVIVLHDTELRRTLVRRGLDAEAALAQIRHRRRLVDDLVRTSRQRIEVWTDANVDQRFRMATGRANLLRAA